MAQNTPPLLVCGAEVDKTAFEAALSEQCERKVRVLTNAIGDKKVWLKMAETNAELALQQRMATSANQQVRLTALREALHLSETTERIECFDISHTMGRGDGGQLCGV